MVLWFLYVLVCMCCSIGGYFLFFIVPVPAEMLCKDTVVCFSHLPTTKCFLSFTYFPMCSLLEGWEALKNIHIMIIMTKTIGIIAVWWVKMFQKCSESTTTNKMCSVHCINLKIQIQIQKKYNHTSYLVLLEGWKMSLPSAMFSLKQNKPTLHSASSSGRVFQSLVIKHGFNDK